MMKDKPDVVAYILIIALVLSVAFVVFAFLMILWQYIQIGGFAR